MTTDAKTEDNEAKAALLAMLSQFDDDEVDMMVSLIAERFHPGAKGFALLIEGGMQRESENAQANRVMLRTSMHPRNLAEILIVAQVQLRRHLRGEAEAAP